MTLSARPVPSTDPVFRRVVEHTAKRSANPDDLAARLRTLYPGVVVAERQLSDEPRVFYVYRDGRFTADSRERWWETPGTAYAEISVRTGRITASTASGDRLLGTSEGDLIGRSYLDFVLPEAREAASVMFETLLALHEVRSEILVRARDGRLSLVEFRAVRDGDVVRVHYRPARGQDRLRLA